MRYITYFVLNGTLGNGSVATVARMKETFDNTFGEREERDERREFMCVAVIVLVGTSLGFLFVFVRESLGLKM